MEVSDIQSASQAEKTQEQGFENRNPLEIAVETGAIGPIHESFLSGIKGLLEEVRTNPEGEVAQLVGTNKGLLTSASEWFAARNNSPANSKDRAIDLVTQEQKQLDTHAEEIKMLKSLDEDVGDAEALLDQSRINLDFIGGFSLDVSGEFRGGVKLEPKAAITNQLNLRTQGKK